MDTTPSRPLARFRAELYQTVLGRRRDALCDLLDAVLTGDHATSLVRHTLVPAFRRRWASAPDALSDGSLDLAALRRLFVHFLPPPPPAQRPLWVIDGSLWPRPEAKTSPARTWGRFVTAGTPESGIVGAWEYQILAALPEPAGSWILPLDLRRRGPDVGTPTALAIAQLRAVLTDWPPDAPRPLVVLDSHYDVGELVRADLGVVLLARLACHRRFYRPPPPYAGTGRPRTHGPVFRLKEPATHGPPDRRQQEADSDCGQVTIEAWARLHPQAAPAVELTVLRVTVAHLPRRAEPPAPLWLVWHGDALPTDLRQVWRWYQRRFAIEHALRFLKQDLGWTAIRPRHPTTADRWSWLLAAALWQLWLARAQVADARLPWEHPVEASKLSPGRVRRGMAGLLARVGTPARAPIPRGKSPGRRRGQCPGRAPRWPVLRRAPPAPALAP
jgi:DDE superfamily endonuclease